MSAYQTLDRRPIHVGFVVTRFEMGGMERCVARVANGLNREHFRVSIVCLDKNGAAQEWLTRDDIEIMELHKGTGNNLKIVERLARLCAVNSIDILHSHNWGTLLESALARIRSRPRVKHIHAERGTVLGSQTARGLKLLMRRWTMRWALRRAELVTTNSLAVAGKIESVTGIPRAALCIIPNGVELPFEREQLVQSRLGTREHLGLGDECILIGTVGRLVPVKNMALAIRGLSLCRQTSKFDYRLVIVGDGPEMAGLKELTVSEGVAQFVSFVGKQDNVWPFLAAMDLYVNTSHSEGMSQSILEAMAVGLPVVASDVGDAAAMLCGDNAGGLVFPSNDVGAFADRVNRLFSTPDSRLTYSWNSRQRHQTSYSEKAMLEKFEAMYRQVASK